jgi:thiosulfate dehydrogenase [quinone] large subunit
MNFKILNIKGIQLVLVILRTAIGWHFLYEGISKLLTPSWTSYNFLSVSKWIFSGFFHWIASNPQVLKVVDILNIWGLILIGLGLFLGIFTRFSSIMGAILLILYYVANPPFIGMDYGMPVEGNYLIIDKNFIEFVVLCVFIIIPSGSLPGIIRLFNILVNHIRKGKSSGENIPGQPQEEPLLIRRELIKNLAVLPFFGGFLAAINRKRAWISYEEKFLKDSSL